MAEIDHRILPERLRAAFDPASLDFECTDELTPLTEFVGQERAIRSLQFGLGMHRPGYNIFVTGMTGTGKATAILEYIRRRVAERQDPYAVHDWCYVYNFDDPDQPNAIPLPPGRGQGLRERLEALLVEIRTNLTHTFASDDYERQRRQLFEEGQAQASSAMSQAQRRAQEAGFSLNFTPTGPVLIPLLGERPMTPEEFNALSLEERQAIEEREKPVGEMVNEVGERLRGLEREVGGAVQQMDRQVVETVVRGPFDALDKDYADQSEVAEFLRKLREFTLKSADFLRQLAAQPATPVVPMTAGMPAPAPDPFLAFHVNVLIDNGGVTSPPIVFEPNPTFTNLFGRIDRRAFMGTYLSDHTMLKPGAVHRANGGYLVLHFNDVTAKPGAWDGLKRMLRTRETRLEDPMEQYGMMTPQTLRPEPIPVDMKLVITGDTLAYYMLSAYDEESWELFKVKADFDHQIPRNAENARAYAGFACAVAEREGLRHLDRGAVGRLVEYGSRAVEDQAKLSARFGRLRDLVVESDYWAAQEGERRVGARHVERALEERVFRVNLLEDRVREMIARGSILIDTEGAVVGQVNGLAVLEFGDLRFGRPMRITARTYLGQRGIVSIDRESQLSGKIHDKGVLILSGYLGWKFGQERPLSLSATISFEQGYDPVEGDSASLGETCAILSSLADIPIRQDIAITGSVNQKGEVQPIGGVNHKIEGFFDVCRELGLSGTQGVIIPARNTHNLMLRDDVVQAARDGRFSVYEVTTVDEALEILTGETADNVHETVVKKLEAMGEALRHTGTAQAPGVVVEREKAPEKPVPPREPGPQDSPG